jgi:hypothetical protein
MLRHRNELGVEGQLPAFHGVTAWLNPEPLATDTLDGHVVLVSFGTYTFAAW